MESVLEQRVQNLERTVRTLRFLAAIACGAAVALGAIAAVLAFRTPSSLRIGDVRIDKDGIGIITGAHWTRIQASQISMSGPDRGTLIEDGRVQLGSDLKSPDHSFTNTELQPGSLLMTYTHDQRHSSAEDTSLLMTVVSAFSRLDMSHERAAVSLAIRAEAELRLENSRQSSTLATKGDEVPAFVTGPTTLDPAKNRR
jgi:hypothetical protein